MSLLREYIRNLLIEKEEKEKTPEAKLKELFMHNTTQALHIAEQVDVDPKMVAAMKEAVSAVHEIMKSFRDGVNAKTRDEILKVPPVRGLYEKFEQSMIDVYGGGLWDGSIRLHDIDKEVYDLYNSAHVIRAYWGEPSAKNRVVKGANSRTYKSVAEWAGEPR